MSNNIPTVKDLHEIRKNYIESKLEELCPDWEPIKFHGKEETCGFCETPCGNSWCPYTPVKK